MAKKGAAATLWRRSMVLMFIIVFVGFGLVFGRLFYLQTAMAEELQKSAVSQQLNDSSIAAKRGNIYDCSGNLLAQSITVWDIVLQPANFSNAKNKEKVQEAVAEGLAKILELDKDELYKKTQGNTFYVLLKRKVNAEIKDKVLEFAEKINKEYKVNGIINIQENYDRYYTHDNFASDILGFTGSDNQGLYGLEYEYDDYLTGKNGRYVVARDPYGVDMPYQYEQKVDATDGYDLILTIDEKVQSIMEKYVRETINEFNVANRGCALMMNVKTGAILGFACENSFNNNDPFTITDENVLAYIRQLPQEERAQAESNALESQWRNKGISDTYVPGSVFKMITASAVLSEGLAPEGTTFHCEGAYSPVEGMNPISCWNIYGHGPNQDVKTALCNSCNPAFMQMGFLLGREKFYEYYVAFGFSEKTGIDLPGESEDYFFQNEGVNGMTLADLAVASFGQNFKITPIQMLCACSAIANKGNLVQPYVVSQIVDTKGNVVKTNQPKIKRQVISEDIATQICGMLEENVVSGGATNGYVAGYRIGAKTGTSEKIGESGVGTKDYIASFCGIAPCDDPEIALLCFFDTPDTSINYYGSAVAGPCFRNIMSEVLPYLGIDKVYSDKTNENLETTTGPYITLSVEQAKAQIEKAGLKVEIVGDGATVTAQNPPAYSTIPKDGTVVIYTEQKPEKSTVNVPDFTGCSLADANYLAAEYHLNLCIAGSVSEEGENYVKSQDVKSGTEVEKYTVITVTFNQDNSIM